MGHKRASKHDENDRELLTHIDSLGLQTVEDYRRWCAANGFSCRLKKDWKDRCRERSKVKAAVIQERIVLKKQEQRNPASLLRDICELRLEADDITQPHLKRLCQAIQAQRASCDPPADLQAFLCLLLHLHACRVDFFGITSVIAEFGHREGNSFVDALVLLSAYRQSWLRPYDAWKPRTHNTRRQFASLLRHLFVQYDMPLFFDSVWFAGPTAKGVDRRAAYLHVGGGGSVRDCDLPIRLTKRMAHYFNQAPSDVTFEKAVRWGQILGLGADERLARAILPTRLGESFDHDNFWVTVIEWFILHPMLDRVHVGPIIDYLYHQRFLSDPCLAPGNQADSPTPRPNLTMKGRTPESLLRNVNQWHRRLASDNAHQVGQWVPTGIDGFEFIEGSETSGSSKLWTIRELLSAQALIAEGRQLHHCVATYRSSCVRGQCSIWTMEVETNKGRTKSLTLEVRNQQRLICQARGKANRTPTEKERGVLRRWAAQAGLVIASYV
jgi:hypothetical protein